MVEGMEDGGRVVGGAGAEEAAVDVVPLAVPGCGSGEGEGEVGVIWRGSRLPAADDMVIGLRQVSRDGASYGQDVGRSRRRCL